MKKRLLKKKLRDLGDDELFELRFEKKLGRRMSYMVRQEMGLRFDEFITTMTIEVPYKSVPNNK